MGNESPQGYVHPIKIPLAKENLSPEDLGVQIEQVFGISNIPVSHRAVLGDSPSRNVDSSVRSFDLPPPKDKKYEQRISHLESEIIHLKSLIEESKYRSRRGSPVRSEVENSPPETSRVQESASRMSQTYFHSRSDSA